MKATSNGNSLHQFEVRRKLNQGNGINKPKIMKENQRITEKNILRKEEKAKHNLIENVSLVEEPFILSETLNNCVLKSPDTQLSSEGCHQNNYFEAEIEPGLLLSGQLVEI